ncbi:hypothetical protein Q5P01_001578 [Channa striata]|uniref:Uncharacterized protein n=1 Tax=Channa striata TaxID=64152 RepID=A0AA88NML1_CHASR|nr:hypothetical protein Q5P01_001578 [Channa striata]
MVNINEESNTDFDHMGNRRKLGSSRRKKGRHHVKISSAEPTEENEENITVAEVLETTETTLALQKTRQEELSQDTQQDITISETDGISLYSTSMPGSSSEVQKPTKYPEADLESFTHQTENPEELCDRGTDFKEKTFNESVAATLEGIVQSQTLHSKDDLSTHEEQDEHFNLPEVTTAHHSEDTVNKELEQAVQPTQMQELQDTDYTFENTTNDLMENSDNCSGDLKGQSEPDDTNHSELTRESTDNSLTTEEVSNPGDGQSENPKEESNVVILHQINAEHVPYDTMTTQIDGLERVVIELPKKLNNESQAEDDINHCADQTSHQERHGLFSEPEDSKSFQALESEIHTHLGSQPQDNMLNINEESNTDFDHMGNRRKLGSSRRKKGRHHVKISSAEPTEENEENVTVAEVLETTETTLALQTTRQEELSQDTQQDITISETDGISLYSTSMPGSSSEVQKPTKYPEADLESFIHQTENPQELCDRGTDFKEKTFNESVESNTDFNRMGNRRKLGSSRRKKERHHVKVSSAEPTEENEENITVAEVLETTETTLALQVQPTQMEKVPQIDYSFQDTIHCLTENFDTCSGKLKDQSVQEVTQMVKSTEMQETSQIYHPGVIHDSTGNSNIISSTSTYEFENKDKHQSKLSVKSTNDSAARQEFSICGKEEHTEENNLDQVKVNYQAYDTKKPQTSEIESVDTCLNTVHEIECQEENEHKSHVEKQVLLTKRESEYSLKALQSEIHPIFDPQNQDNSISIDEQHSTGLSCSGSKRKLGGSHRNEGPQRFKNSIAESYQKPIDQSDFTDLHDKKCLHVSSVTDTESKERKKDTELLSQWGILQASSELHLKSDGINPSVTMERNTEKNSPEQHTELRCSVEQPAGLLPNELPTNEEQSEHFNLTEVRGAQNSEDAAKKVPEDDINSTPVQEMHQINYISDKEEKSSVQTLQLEVHAPLDSQPQDHSKNIKEETQTGFKFTANKRKLGSSRRNKGRQHGLDTDTETYHKPKEEVVQNTCGDESSETTKVSLETTRLEELKQQTDPGFKPAEGTTKTIQEEDTTLSQNITETTTMVTVDFTRSNKDDLLNYSKKTEKEREKDTELLMQWGILQASSLVSDFHLKSHSIDGVDEDDLLKSSQEFNEDKKKKDRNELENIAFLTDKGSVKMVLTPDASSLKDDSGLQRMQYHDDNVSSKSVISNVLCQEEASQDQNIESLCRDKVLLEQKVDLGDSKKSAMFSAMGAQRSQQDVQEKTNLDSNENLEGKSTQRRRKMGSTRKLIKRTGEQVDDKDETGQSNLDIKVDKIKLGMMEAVEELPAIATRQVSQNEKVELSLRTVDKEQHTDPTSGVHDEEQKIGSITSDLHIVESNIIPGRDDYMTLLYEQSASHSEDSVNKACVRDNERNIGEEPLQLNDSAIHISSRNRRSVNPNTEDTINADYMPMSFNETGQNDGLNKEEITVIQDQPLKSEEAAGVAAPYLEKVKFVVSGEAGEENVQASAQELYATNQEAHNTNSEIKIASPNFSSTDRKRKLGSTRKNLGSQSKRDNLHEKREVDKEVTVPVVGDVLTGNASGVKEPQLHTEREESNFEQRTEQAFESHTCESQVKALVHHNVKESPASLREVVETEPQVSPDYLTENSSTSTKPVVMSELASEGRRRKMGSHRKSRGNRDHKDQITEEDGIKDQQKGGDARTMTEESGIKTINEDREESLGLDKKSEVGESEKKPSSNISSSGAGESSQPASHKAPKPANQVTTHTPTPFGSESQKTLSLAGKSPGADIGSNIYNVLMVGDTCVGKTSFIKRAQSGKFSLDLPSSVGLDSCKWTVVVDGKPVVLHLWDTAGQERFHSITRQIFHKAQAFLLMYDITSHKSFSAVSYWANCIQEGAGDNVIILLIGNKSDCADRQVKTQDGEILAKEYNFEFMECSAATGENVIHCLENMARMLSQKADTRQEPMVLNKESQQKQRSGCC